MWYKKESKYGYYHNGTVLYFKDEATAGVGVYITPGWLFAHGWTLADKVPSIYRRWIKENISW